MKKRASKVAHNRPKPFYFIGQPRPQPRIDLSYYYEISGPDICSRICGIAITRKIETRKEKLYNYMKLSMYECIFIGIYSVYKNLYKLSISVVDVVK